MTEIYMQHFSKTRWLLAIVLLAANRDAQVTTAEYERALTLRTKFQGLALNIPGPANWIGANRFWYRKSVQGGNAFVLVDTATLTKAPAFDHGRLGASLSAAAKGKYTAATLPLSVITFVDQ